jgi:hypothetical protein
MPSVEKGWKGGVTPPPLHHQPSYPSCSMSSLVKSLMTTSLLIILFSYCPLYLQFSADRVEMSKGDVFVTLLLDFLHHDNEARLWIKLSMHSMKDDFLNNKASNKCKKTVRAHTELILLFILITVVVRNDFFGSGSGSGS